MDTLSVFKTHAPEPILEDTCRKSAVCIPFVEKEDGLYILFELRPGSMAENANDICFPGGRIEEGETPEAAALRELKEELLIKDEDIEYIGEGDVFHNFAVHVSSFIVRLKNYSGTFDAGEVAKTFQVPLKDLLEAPEESSLMEWRAELPEGFPYERISGGKDHKFRRQRYRQYFYPTPEGWVWGITGKLLYACLQTIKNGK